MVLARASDNTLLTVVPVYNGERYIAHTLRSIQAQTRMPDRLVVLDNRSEDKTQEIVRSFGSFCEWRQNERNLGLFGNLNRALHFADSAEYLHILHADDALEPGFYEKMTRALAGAPGRAMAYCSAQLMDDGGKTLGHVECKSTVRPVSRKKFICGRAELTPFYFPTVLLKTSHRQAPVLFREDLPQLADQVFWAEWARHSEVVVEVKEPLALYRVHAESGTTRNIRDMKAWVLDELRAMDLIESLNEWGGVRRWLRRQKLRCIFAARSQVKIKQLRASAPEFAREIGRVAPGKAGRLPWALGSLAAALLR